MCMKVLLFNSSSHQQGCTYTALSIIAKALNEEGIETEIIQLFNAVKHDCTGCGACRKIGHCVFQDDEINQIVLKAKEADGFIFGSPVYYAHPSGRLLSAMDRLFYSGSSAFRKKPAAAIVSARRAGTTASLDAITKHFSINEMPIISSNYWNMVHGVSAEDVLKDEEGCQIMRILGKNMAWILKCIEAGKENGINPPITEGKIHTNFIR